MQIPTVLQTVAAVLVLHVAQVACAEEECHTFKECESQSSCCADECCVAKYCVPGYNNASCPAALCDRATGDVATCCTALSSTAKLGQALGTVYKELTGILNDILRIPTDLFTPFGILKILGDIQNLILGLPGRIRRILQALASIITGLLPSLVETLWQLLGGFVSTQEKVQ